MLYSQKYYTIINKLYFNLNEIKEELSELYSPFLESHDPVQPKD